jgi:small conductance mechanosensitive channel
MDKLNEYSDILVDYALQYGPKLIGAIVTLIIGLWVIKAIMKGVEKGFQKREIDPSLTPFLKGIISTLLKVVLIISVLSMIGIAMTSFVAIIGSIGLAVGLALSGTLQNFAGGVIILIIKPFKVGDYIEAQGYDGTVNQIQIFNTILKTPDNKTVIIPNGGLSTGSMINYSTEATRRISWTFGIGYGDKVEQAREILMKMFKEDERILADPEPAVLVSELADSSVNLSARVWVNAGDYWPVFWKMNEEAYNKFNAEGINIPFPQMDVHMHKENA